MLVKKRKLPLLVSSAMVGLVLSGAANAESVPGATKPTGNKASAQNCLRE